MNMQLQVFQFWQDDAESNSSSVTHVKILMKTM